MTDFKNRVCNFIQEKGYDYDSLSCMGYVDINNNCMNCIDLAYNHFCDDGAIPNEAYEYIINLISSPSLSKASWLTDEERSLLNKKYVNLLREGDACEMRP